jgi:hypothetical protein
LAIDAVLPSARRVRLDYQPPTNNTFFSEQISYHQPVSSTFLSEQTSTSHQALFSFFHFPHYRVYSFRFEKNGV